MHTFLPTYSTLSQEAECTCHINCSILTPLFWHYYNICWKWIIIIIITIITIIIIAKK
jgi:hypothetical protein